jgi:hypothetical protein
MFIGEEEKAPCQRKKPTTSSGRVQSKMTRQESFITNGLYAELAKNMR